MFPKHTNSIENRVSSKQLLIGSLSGSRDASYYVGSRVVHSRGTFTERPQDTHWEVDALMREMLDVVKKTPVAPVMGNLG